MAIANQAADKKSSPNTARHLHDLCLVCICLLLMLICATASVANARPVPNFARAILLADDQAYPPYIYVDKDGNPAGFQADLLALIAQDTGLEFNWTLTEWAIAVDLLRNEQIDIISGMNITDARRNEFVFTRPYLHDKGILFVPVDSYHIHSISDLSGRRVGVQKGDVAEWFLQNQPTQPNLHSFPNQQDLLHALVERKIDAAVCNYYSGLYYLYQSNLDSKVKSIGKPLYQHSYAMAANRRNLESQQYLAAIDQSIQKLESSGQIEALRQKWFGGQELIMGLSRSKTMSYAKNTAVVLALFGTGIWAFIWFLRRKIARATHEITAKRDELHKAFQELASQNEELLAQDELLDYQNKTLIAHEQRLKERTQALEALHNTTLDVLQLDQCTEFFQHILERIAQLAGTPHGIIDTWDDDEHNCQTRASIGVGTQSYYTPGKGLSYEVFRTQGTVIVQNYNSWQYRDELQELSVLKAAVGIPILIAGKIRGTVCLGFDHADKTFAPDLIQMLEQFVQMAAIVLDRLDKSSALQNSEERYRLAFEVSNDAIFDWNLLSGIIRWSEKWVDRMNFSPEKTDKCLVSVQQFGDRIHPQDRALHETRLTDHLQGQQPYYSCEYRLQDAMGEYFWVKSQGKKIGGDRETEGRLIGALTDINEAKQKQKQIHALAYRDPLTGLPNRRAFFDRMQEQVSMSLKNVSAGLLLFLDIDEFKLINDSFGHTYGDLLLIELGKRLSGFIGEKDMFARLGGDEFVFIVPTMDSREKAEIFIRQIMLGVNQPFDIDGHKFFCSASIGAVMYPLDGTSVSDLYKNADTSLHAAKNSGKNGWRFFDPKMRDEVQTRMKLASGLRHAVENNELFLVFQPIVSRDGKTVVGFESLLRWQSPENGMIPPCDFIPLAEETGRIIEIGEWVINNACEFMTQLHALGYGDLFVAVNVSARQIIDEGFVDMVSATLNKTMLKPSCLELEVTESVLMESFAESRLKLQALRELGITLALDDFGTGYSSLTYLKNLPINKVKIDKTFLLDIETKNENMAILRAIIQLCHSLGLSVVAEGVENDQQHCALAEEWCDYMQGFLWGHPAIESETIRFLKDWKAI